MDDYAAAGVDTIIGSGYPHLEEAYRVAELLFPQLNLRDRRSGGLPPLRPLFDSTKNGSAPAIRAT